MKKFNLLSILLFCATITFGGTITKTYKIANPKIATAGNYQTISFDNTMLTGISGEPSLPYFAVSLLLPPGEVATKIEFVGTDEVIVDGDFLLVPYQTSKPLSESKPSEFQINNKIYASNAMYPASPVGTLSTNFLNGRSIAMSAFTPVRYVPAEGKLSYFSTVTIKVETTTSKNANDILKMVSSSNIVSDRLLKIAQNPEIDNLYSSYYNRSATDYSLLIITPNQFVDDFDELRNIYLSRGKVSEVATTEDIAANIPGQDMQEKIRNYIIQEYQESNIDFVILGGDVEYVPYRGFSCDVQSGGGYSSDDIPADLYYCALDGTWNDDGDNRWGEPDEDDLLPEVALARYPFSNATELASIINKSIKYQNSPVLGELVTPLLAGEHLYSDPETWGRDYLDLLIGERNDNGYTTIGIPETNQIDSLYEHDGSWSGSDLINEINQGKQFIHHVGHASPTYVAHLNNSDITNSNFYGANGIDHNYTLFHTHGCDCGSFDNNDCILEKMVTIDNFAVSVIGNSRFGWFNEGQSEGPAAHLHREMVDAMYHEKLYNLGNAFVEAKIQTAPWVEAPGQWEEGALRWNFYDLNILGDPVLSVWTAEPISIDVDYADILSVGTVSTTVVVSTDGTPLNDFTCTILKDGVLHATGVTDTLGIATLTFDPIVNEVGDAMLIVVGQNCLPDTNMISFVPSEGAYVIYDSHQIIDNQGNNNGLADFGESVLLTLAVNNVGVENAPAVMATISTIDEYIIITDDNESYGDVAAGAIVTKDEAFSFDVSDSIPDQHEVYFTLTCESNGNTWLSDFSVIVNAPVPVVGELVIDDSANGNGNGELDPGETVTIIVSSLNDGHSDCVSAQMNLITTNPYISIINSSFNLDGLLAGESKQAEFEVVVDGAAPVGTVIDFACNLNTCNYTDDKTYYRNVGLLKEDFETGDFLSYEWHMGGSAPWLIDADNPFNGVYCSKSGTISDDATSELYINLTVISDDVISFARKVSSEDTYDFLKFYIDDVMIGQWSGEQDWQVVTFDISEGSHTLLWSYEKDMSVSGGSDCAWIDDVVFPASTTIISVDDVVNNNSSFIYPNPGNGKYTISGNFNDESSNIIVRNALGAVVANNDVVFVAGKANIDISNLVQGVYFVQVKQGNVLITKKIVKQ